MIMALLISDDQSVVKKQFKVEEAAVTIGRHPECEVVIDDNSVSRRHATIFHESGQYFIEDLKSRNGTIVNGNEIHGRTRLFDGSEIRICDIGFYFQLDDVIPSKPLTTRHDQPSSLIRSSFFLEDDGGKSSSTIMGQVDVPSQHARRAEAGDLQKKLKAISSVTHALGSAFERDEILNKVLETLFELFVDSDRGFVAMAGPDGNVVPHLMKTRRPQDAERVRISRTIVRLVMESRQAILSSDAASDDRFDLSQSIVEFRIRSMMCAPLLDASGNSIGVIQLDTLRSAIAFDQNDLEVLVTVAVQASLALQRADLFKQAELNRQLEQDLRLAHEVQLRFLPQANPKLDDYSFFSHYRPTSQVGGDYFDYIRVSDRQLIVIVADVVGHGVAAALLMAKISAEARFACAIHRDPVVAVRQMNQSLSGLNLDKFVTLLLGCLDCQTHELTFVNAGHMPPLIRTARNQVSYLSDDRAGLPLGIADDAEYLAETIRLQKGDVVLMYTDGVNESMNEAGEQLGLERLAQEIEQSQAKSPEAVGKTVCQAIKNHVRGYRQFDDICLVSLGR